MGRPSEVMWGLTSWRAWAGRVRMAGTAVACAGAVADVLSVLEYGVRTTTARTVSIVAAVGVLLVLLAEARLRPVYPDTSDRDGIITGPAIGGAWVGLAVGVWGTSSVLRGGPTWPILVVIPLAALAGWGFLTDRDSPWTFLGLVAFPAAGAVAGLALHVVGREGPVAAVVVGGTVAIYVGAACVAAVVHEFEVNWYAGSFAGVVVGVVVVLLAGPVSGWPPTVARSGAVMTGVAITVLGVVCFLRREEQTILLVLAVIGWLGVTVSAGAILVGILLDGLGSTSDAVVVGVIVGVIGVVAAALTLLFGHALREMYRSAIRAPWISPLDEIDDLDTDDGPRRDADSGVDRRDGLIPELDSDLVGTLARVARVLRHLDDAGPDRPTLPTALGDRVALGAVERVLRAVHPAQSWRPGASRPADPAATGELADPDGWALPPLRPITVDGRDVRTLGEAAAALRRILADGPRSRPARALAVRADARRRADILRVLHAGARAAYPPLGAGARPALILPALVEDLGRAHGILTVVDIGDAPLLLRRISAAGGADVVLTAAEAQAHERFTAVLEPHLPVHRNWLLPRRDARSRP